MVRTRLELVLEQVSGQREIWDCTKLQAYAKMTLEHAKKLEPRQVYQSKSEVRERLSHTGPSWKTPRLSERGP